MGETDERAKRGIEINLDNSGTLFPSEDQRNLEGAFKIEGVTYDVKTVVNQMRDGSDYYRLEGTGRADATQTLAGAMFPRETKVTDSGTSTPSYMGDVTLRPAGKKKDIAAWDKKGKAPPHRDYVSLSIKDPRPRPQ